MPKYIEREALLKAIDTSLHNNPHEYWLVAKAHNQEHQHLLRMVLAQPTADVVEVKHGEWVEYQTPNIICCSECDWGTGIDEKSFKYCPNCGAKMDLKEGAEE